MTTGDIEEDTKAVLLDFKENKLNFARTMLVGAETPNTIDRLVTATHRDKINSSLITDFVYTLTHPSYSP